VRGLFEALRRFGTIPWERAVAPAAAIARRGFPVSSFMRQDWEFDTGPDVVSHSTRLQATAEAKRIFTKRGELYRVGESIVLEDYARTLTQIGSDGPDAFYTGPLAQAMAKDFEANGASITADDLASYRVGWSTAVEGIFNGTRIVVPGPPAGGVALIQLLNYLEGSEFSRPWPSAAEAQLRAEAMRWVFDEQLRYMADPGFVPVPVEEMIDKDRAAGARRDAADRSLLPATPYADAATTTQLSVCDDEGNAVSLTHTLGTWSGVVTPSLGFGYNNYLSAFDPRPSGRNSLAPGKTRVTMMTPTLLFDDDRLSGVIGGVGGNKILTGVGQSLVNLLGHGMTPVEAVSAARIHCDGGPVHLERRIPSDVQHDLELRGYQADRHPLSYDLYFALVQLVAIGPDGSAKGASDPRGDGGMALVP
jgi:gamma-glutamyltranspeptidase/glutathione hydrolase